MELEADSRALYVISVAAELAGVHPQTLRIYERKGLIEPARTSGGSRRYSDRDIQLLRRVQELTNEGLSLAGVARVLELEEELAKARIREERLHARLADLEREVAELRRRPRRADLVPRRSLLAGLGGLRPARPADRDLAREQR
jgi:MerR family transcriptional regulator/heat shock protein HspR